MTKQLSIVEQKHVHQPLARLSQRPTATPSRPGHRVSQRMLVQRSSDGAFGLDDAAVMVQP